MYSFEPVTRNFENFNKFIINSPQGNFRQTSYWGEIKYYSGWIPKYYALLKNGNFHGTALIQLRKIPFTPFHLAYCCRGPIIDWSDTHKCEFLFMNLKNIVKNHLIICLRFDPELSNYNETEENILHNTGLLKIHDKVTTWNRNLYTTRVFLHKNENELVAQMRRTHRQNINKANRSGVTINSDILNYDKEKFYQLMKGLENRGCFLYPKK